jgi:hypothetical protein
LGTLYISRDQECQSKVRDKPGISRGERDGDFGIAESGLAVTQLRGGNASLARNIRPGRVDRVRAGKGC